MAETQPKNISSQPPTTRCEVIQGIVVLVHDQLQPSNEDWQAFLEAIDQTHRQHGTARILVYTPGPAPNAGQRQEIATRAKKYSLRIAVCTDSRLARGVIQALSWVSGLQIKPFGADDFIGACAHLEVAADRAPLFARRVHELHSELAQASGKFKKSPIS